MTYYHCSPIAGITALEPRKPETFDKPARVYLTTLLPMALMYGIRNYEYSYGYTKAGQIYLVEYFPNALEELYRGKSASLYICAPESVEPTRIPNEAVSEKAVPVVKEITIPDVCEALLEQERLGALVIHRYPELLPKMLDWVRRVEADCIRKNDLLNTPGEMADYYRRHYPESWAVVEAERQLYHGSAVPALTELLPLSDLHGSHEKVVYLSPSISYTLLYIWNAERTQYSRKWVTGWVKDGIAYYEEQFPGQLKAFYEGVRGYVYSVLKNGDVQLLPNREDLFYSSTPIRVYRVTEIPDVYQALLEYERAGKLRVLRFEDASEEKQAELTDRIAAYITEHNLLEQDSEESRFMKRYFARAWEKAKNKSMIQKAGIKDLPIIAELACQLWPAHRVEEMRSEFAKIITKQDAAFFLAYDGENAIGFAQCQLRHDYVEGTDTSPVGYLEGIFVAEGYRKQGIAKNLLSECEKWAKEKGCAEFAGDCELDNVQSLRFHRKVGFEEANRIICFTKKMSDNPNLHLE